MWFMRFSYYKTANRTVPCGVVRCGALLLAIQCGYAILQAILMRFMRFMRFGEHPYSRLSNRGHDVSLPHAVLTFKHHHLANLNS